MYKIVSKNENPQNVVGVLNVLRVLLHPALPPFFLLVIEERKALAQLAKELKKRKKKVYIFFLTQAVLKDE